MLIVSIIVPLFMQAPKAQAAEFTAEDKALSFIDDVIQLDMSKYQATLYKNESGRNHLFHLFYKLYPTEPATLFSFSSDTLAIFNFYNATLGSCQLNQSKIPN
ncbi:MAG: hypothetical protein NWE98_06155 [Candidatus Bathyarchaeota archaeon]|nr:hypothetical protein [Candidatus Bathyarchaeota archaeon]